MTDLLHPVSQSSCTFHTQDGAVRAAKMAFLGILWDALEPPSPAASASAAGMWISMLSATVILVLATACAACTTPQAPTASTVRMVSTGAPWPPGLRTSVHVSTHFPDPWGKAWEPLSSALIQDPHRMLRKLPSLFSRTSGFVLSPRPLQCWCLISSDPTVSPPLTPILLIQHRLASALST